MAATQPMQVKTAINKVANMPFKWSLNPYRGCGHACVYCYARVTHEYMGLGTGRAFDTQVFHKENLIAALEKQLSSARWRGEAVALGTATDCYQPAEGRRKLTRAVLETMLRHGNPVSITTKSPMVLRDLDILQDLARGPGVVVHFSVGTLDPAWRWLEPGTAAPRYRLRALRTLANAGIRAGVLMAPIVPRITDAPHQLDAVAQAAAQAGAHFLVPIVLRLQHGAREWFTQALASQRPDLARIYGAFYRSDYAPPGYVRRIEDTVAQLRRRYGIASHEDHGQKTMPAPNRRWDKHAGTYPERRERQLRLPL